MRMRLAAGLHLGTLGDGIGNMAFNLRKPLVINNRTLFNTLFKPTANLHGGGGFGKPPGELVIDAILHEHPVGADAGLAGIAIFRRHRAGNGHIHIGIIEHDQRCVATQLKAHLLECICTLAHEDPADFGRAGKGHLADTVIITQRTAHGRCIHAGHDIHHTGGQSGPVGQFGKGQRRQRCLFGRLQHTGTARGNARRHLAGDHRDREIPRGNGTKHPDRLFEGQKPLVGDRAFHHIAADAARLFGKPVDEACTIDNLAARLGQWLAHFGGQDDRQIISIRHDQIIPFAHHHGAVLGRACGPFLLRRCGCINSGGDITCPKIGNLGHNLASGRIGDGKALVTSGFGPGTVDVGIDTQQGWIVQVHGFKVSRFIKRSSEYGMFRSKRRGRLFGACPDTRDMC